MRTIEQIISSMRNDRADIGVYLEEVNSFLTYFLPVLEQEATTWKAAHLGWEHMNRLRIILGYKPLLPVSYPHITYFTETR